MGPITAKSITGYVKPTFRTRQDADFSPKDLGSLNLSERAEQFSQEIQLLSNASGAAPFTWILGAYYFHEKGSRESSYRGSRYRSEEHTSELQSLMRTSYAVFCLQKKKTKRLH